MERSRAHDLLRAVAAGTTSATEALELLAAAPYEELAHSMVDTHRQLRTGDPEVVYAAGKSTGQVLDIVRVLRRTDGRVLITRAGPETAHAVQQEWPDTVRDGATLLIGEPPTARGTVAVLAAGTSDGPVAGEAVLTARAFGTDVTRVDDCGVAGLHRLIAARDALVSADCVVVVAGMEGALPSVVGGMVGTPVVAVPTSVGYGASFGGLAALLGMLTSCAPGIAVVNIDNGFGAGVFAARVARR